MNGARSNRFPRGYEHLAPDGAKNLLDRDQVPQRAKAPIADSADNDQMLGPAKRAEPFTVVDDALSQTFPDPGKFLEFCGGRGVDIDTLGV